MLGRGTLVAVAAALITAAPAHAMKTYVNHDALVVVAGAGEINVTTITPDPSAAGGFLISDPGASITAGEGCTPLGRAAVRCALDAEYPVPSLTLSLGDRGDVAKVDGHFFYFDVNAGAGDDRLDLVGGQASSTFFGPYTRVDLGAGKDTLELTESFEGTTEVYGGGGADDIHAAGWISGGDGDDRIRGGLQPDFISGDGGNDTIDANSSSWDAVDCGAGADTALVDGMDEPQACETVTLCPYAGDTSRPPHLGCLGSEARGLLP